jgi:hypothetical protein
MRRRAPMTETVAPAKLESTTGPRAASDDAKPGNERGRQLRRPYFRELAIARSCDLSHLDVRSLGTCKLYANDQNQLHPRLTGGARRWYGAVLERSDHAPNYRSRVDK